MSQRRRISDAVIHALVRVGSWVLTRCMRPFSSLTRRWHSWVASLLDRIGSGEELHVAYDPYRNTYIVDSTVVGADASAYKTGHMAGRISIVLGFLPLVLALMLFEVLAASFVYFPAHWAFGIVALVMVASMLCFTLAVVERGITLGVVWEGNDADLEGSE